MATVDSFRPVYNKVYYVILFRGKGKHRAQYEYQGTLVRHADGFELQGGQRIKFKNIKSISSKTE